MGWGFDAAFATAIGFAVGLFAGWKSGLDALDVARMLLSAF